MQSIANTAKKRYKLWEKNGSKQPPQDSNDQYYGAQLTKYNETCRMNITFSNIRPSSARGAGDIGVTYNLWRDSIGIKKDGKIFPEIYCSYPSIVKRTIINDNEYAKIENAHSPFYMDIAHELIHIKHRIENTNYTIDSEYGIASRKYRTSRFREKEKYQRRGGEVFNNDEEVATLLDIYDVSEANIRAEKKLPIRYPYLNSTDFYEPMQHIKRIMSSFADNQFRVVMSHSNKEEVYQALKLPIVPFNEKYKNSIYHLSTTQEDIEKHNNQQNIMLSLVKNGLNKLFIKKSIL